MTARNRLNFLALSSLFLCHGVHYTVRQSSLCKNKSAAVNSEVRVHGLCLLPAGGGGGSEGWGGKRDCPGDYSTFALSLRFQLYRGVGLNQLQCSRNILSLELIFASRKLRIQKHKRLKKRGPSSPLFRGSAHSLVILLL